jgi:hypothetical protein
MLIHAQPQKTPRVRVRARSVFGRFNELPEATVENYPVLSSGQWNTWFYTQADGIQKVPDFFPRWAGAVSLSHHAVGLRHEPEAQGLFNLEMTLGGNLDRLLREATKLFVWDMPFGRSSQRQAQLDHTYGLIDAELTRFHEQIGGAIAATQTAIQDRINREAKAAQDAADRRAKEEEAVRAAAEARAKEAQLVAERLETERLVEKERQYEIDPTLRPPEARPALASIGGIGLAGAALAAIGLGAYWMFGQKKGKR